MMSPFSGIACKYSSLVSNILSYFKYSVYPQAIGGVFLIAPFDKFVGIFNLLVLQVLITLQEPLWRMYIYSKGSPVLIITSSKWNNYAINWLASGIKTKGYKCLKNLNDLNILIFYSNSSYIKTINIFLKLSLLIANKWHLSDA